jgi:endonuclease/exonuclease/phosphatase family metal-dependent hydrolase
MSAAKESHHIRVVTYNIHKCRGMDRRVRPERIVKVLGEVDADIVALQEVISREDTKREEDQARFIAAELGLHFSLGENRKEKGGAYGNALLSRFPLHSTCNHDITMRGREPRGCLRADIELPGGRRLHIFNVHMGTAFMERRKQVRKLISDEVVNHPDLNGSRIVLGDFNEWTRGLATRLLRSQLVSADLRVHLNRSRTYPALLPFLHLDHIYFDPSLMIERMAVHRTRVSLIASDHVPLVADFSFTNAA